jgi:hypothetical protein
VALPTRYQYHYLEMETRHPERPVVLSERGLVEAVIKFVNKGDYPSWNSVCTGSDCSRWPEPPGWRDLTAAHEVQPARSDPNQKRAMPPLTSPTVERTALRSALTDIVAGTVTHERLSLWEKHASGLMLKPSYIDGQVQLLPAYLGAETFDSPPSAPFAYVLMLLVDRHRLLGSDLRQCQFASCRKFFMVVRKPGQRPRERYCSKSCMEKTHDAGALERVRRSRLRQKQRAAQKTRRR